MERLSTNAILTLITIIVGVIFLILMYMKSKRSAQEIEMEDKMTFDKLLDRVKTSLANTVSEDNLTAVTAEDFDASYARRKRLQHAMRTCVYGIIDSKIIVQGMIRDVVAETLPTREDIMAIYDFDEGRIETRIKFEILMYFYKKDYDKDALTRMIKEYQLDKDKYEIEDKTQSTYSITDEDINRIYADKNYDISYPALLDIMSVLLYQKYKGFGVVDTLQEMNINGFNCGTSGSILAPLLNKNKKVPEAARSVWLAFQGKYIHLRFLTFGSEEELRRVVNLIIRYNNPGPLTEKRGYLVNTMYDKSRVLAMRPPASEYWAVFVRKFTIKDATTEKLLTKSFKPEIDIPQETFERVTKGESIEGYTKGIDLIVSMLKFLMKGEVTCGVTGRQGSGKTTLATTLIRFMDPKHNIRVLELAPEMYLRELYPLRNILSLQETDYVSATALQDATKKSDAAITIVGEVASNEVAARMIQSGQLAAASTLFTHHGATTQRMVESLRNSLVVAAGYTMDTAEEQVVEVVKVDIHAAVTTDGLYYIERITEIIEHRDDTTYPEYDPKQRQAVMDLAQLKYYKNKTENKKFITRDVLKYNLDTHTYELRAPFSTQLTKHMLERMPTKVADEFKQFIIRNWQV